MKQNRLTISAKICLAVIGGELLVLALAGFFWVGALYDQLEAELAARLTVPAYLFEQKVLAGSRLNDSAYLSNLVGERITNSRLIDDYSSRRIIDNTPFGVFGDGQRNISLSYLGDHYDKKITALVPLLPRSKDAGALFMTVDPSKLNERKQRILFLYCCMSAAVVLLSAGVAALVSRHTIVPRIEKFQRVLERTIEGDFEARVETKPSGDELNRCLIMVNALVETLAGYIDKLAELNNTAELLSKALNRDEVLRVVAEVIEKHFKVECIGLFSVPEFEKKFLEDNAATRLEERGARTILAGKVYLSEPEGAVESGRTGSRNTIINLFVPILDESEVADVLVFSGSECNLRLDPVTRQFARTLARLMEGVFGRIKSLHDITQAESKYRALFMTAEGGIYRVDANGVFEDVNPALAAMGGYASVEDMLMSVTGTSQVYADISDRSRVMEKLDREDRVKDEELELKRKDGSTFPVSLSAHTVRNQFGDLIAVEGFVLDLTERKLRESAERERAAAEAASEVKTALLSELEEKNRQLQESLEEVRLMQTQLLQSEKAAAVGAMAKGIARDLNNFLAGTISYPELLLLQLDQNSDLRGPIEEVREAGKQAVALVNDLLMLSDRTEEAWEHAELNMIVEQVLASLDIRKIQTVNPDLQVETSLCKDFTGISCLPVHLSQAITHLLKTSLRGAGESGTVKVSTSVLDIRNVDTDSLGLQAGPHVVLKIADNGIPVSQEHLPHIFEPFYSTTVFGVDQENSGLGLAMADSIVQEHGGTCALESITEGNIFSLFLPITDHLPISSEEQTEGSDFFEGRGTVLVVDDEPLQREIAGKMLTRLGYQAYLVSSGHAAIDFVKHQKVDLILLDMLMPPGINGRETYEHILRINPNQKALIVSGYSKSTDVAKAIELGAGGLLKKPYTYLQFGQAVQTALMDA